MSDLLQDLHKLKNYYDALGCWYIRDQIQKQIEVLKNEHT